MAHAFGPHRPIDDADLPDGRDLLATLIAAQDRSEAATLKWIMSDDHRAELLTELGRTISVLDRAASCWWGCSKSAHSLEYMLGGIESFSLGALRLILLGLYDEALSLARAIGERANLLLLFVYSEDDFKTWIMSSERERIRKYGPAKVRIMIEQLGQKVPVAELDYSALSSVGMHPGSMPPQVYNEQRRPVLGGHFQEDGAKIALNKLAQVTALASALGMGILGHLPVPLRMELMARPIRLAECLDGGPVFPDLGEYLANRSEPAAETPQTD